MEFQNLKKPDYEAIMAKYNDPDAEVFCPRCGNRMEVLLKAKSEKLGNIVSIECMTPLCLFYPIPPNLTPESIKWKKMECLAEGTTIYVVSAERREPDNSQECWFRRLESAQYKYNYWIKEEGEGELIGASLEKVSDGKREMIDRVAFT